ncbi:MDR family MFS transporter [Thermogemmatispora onikobensis]|uniref:MDR family MFS transporter n=1 Tax=Thermogemmatispora onikobensis TaxID=732234 RepID=UPI000853D970|nr:MFS transporter [Thermogemmatispora onikobensis]
MQRRRRGILVPGAPFPPSFWILVGGIFVNRFGSFVGVFLLVYLTAQGYPTAQAGFAAGAYGLGSMAAALFGGSLADHRGRRWTIVVAMFSSAAATLALSQARAMPALVGLATLAGFCAALYRPAASALLTELVPREQRLPAFAWYRFALNVGFTAGPLLAGFFASHAFFFLIFLTDAFSSVIFGVLALVALPAESSGAAQQQPPTRAGFVEALHHDPRFLLFLLGSLAVAMVYFQHQSTLVLQVHSLGLSNAVYGALLSLNGLVVIVFELPLSQVTSKCPLLPLIAIGWLLTALGFGLVAFASNLVFLASTVILWSVGEILHHPASAAYVADLAPAHLRGRYQGVWDLTWNLAQTAGPPLGTLAFSWDAPRFWWLCGLLTSVAVLPLVLGQAPDQASIQAARPSAETPALRRSGPPPSPLRKKSGPPGRRSRALLNYLSLLPKGTDVDLRTIQQVICCSYPQARHLVEALERQGYVLRAAGPRRRYCLHPSYRPAAVRLRHQ